MSLKVLDVRARDYKKQSFRHSSTIYQRLFITRHAGRVNREDFRKRFRFFLLHDSRAYRITCNLENPTSFFCDLVDSGRSLFVRALKQINREKCEHASRFRRLCAQKNTHVERKTKKKKKKCQIHGCRFSFLADATCYR